MTFQVKQIFSDQAKRRAFAIRVRVFVREQGVPAEVELDDDDQHAIHFLATISGRVVGTARLVIHGNNAKIGRMAVLKKIEVKVLALPCSSSQSPRPNAEEPERYTYTRKCR